MSYDPDLQSKSKEKGGGRKGSSNKRTKKETKKSSLSSLFPSMDVLFRVYSQQIAAVFVFIFKGKDGESFLHLTPPLQVYVSHATNRQKGERQRRRSVDRMRRTRDGGEKKKKKKKKDLRISPRKSLEQTKFGRDYLHKWAERKSKKKTGLLAVLARRIKNIYQSYP